MLLLFFSRSCGGLCVEIDVAIWCMVVEMGWVVFVRF